MKCFNSWFIRTLCFFIAAVFTAYVSFEICAYYGEFLGEEFSPNKEFSLRYYRKPKLFEMNFTMPGDSTCRPVWIRLYDSNDVKHAEKLTDNCNLEGRTYWFENEVLLRDFRTTWVLPHKIKTSLP
ncbi:MAG: hypothetical protein D6B27_02900 [Gammaproteobacteria bacterium]|nr:MAG: hypothetical protein D6B27_02900 [Gammaproteobacteria bacterium]